MILAAFIMVGCRGLDTVSGTGGSPGGGSGVDSQGLGFRVPLLVISPLAKQGYISHVQMDQVSILKFIQWNWGVASLNPRNNMGNDIRNMYQGF
jgi:phospholipase C